MLKVWIVGTYPAGTLDTFRKLLPEEKFQVRAAETQEVFDAVTDADAIILRVLKMPLAQEFERMPNLKMVMRWGAGFDNVNIEEAGRRGVRVCNMPGANSYAVAELAVALMIDVRRHAFGYYDNIRQGNWDRNAYSNVTLNQKTLGLYGGGNISRLVGQRARAFGADVQYYDISRLDQKTERQFGLTFVSLDQLLETSDIISVHLPLLESTRHIIGAEQLKKMKHGVTIMNTARGGLIDDAALEAALASGQVGSAGLDCVENEDSETTRRLCTYPNVVLTPHIGGTCNDLGSAMIPMAVENLEALASGKPLAHIVNSRFLGTGKYATPVVNTARNSRLK